MVLGCLSPAPNTLGLVVDAQTHGLSFLKGGAAVIHKQDAPDCRVPFPQHVKIGHLTVTIALGDHPVNSGPLHVCGKAPDYR